MSEGSRTGKDLDSLELGDVASRSVLQADGDGTAGVVVLLRLPGEREGLIENRVDLVVSELVSVNGGGGRHREESRESLHFDESVGKSWLMSVEKEASRGDGSQQFRFFYNPVTGWKSNCRCEAAPKEKKTIVLDKLEEMFLRVRVLSHTSKPGKLAQQRRVISMIPFLFLF